MKNGKFIISLDFELMWGVHDIESIDSYGDAIIGTRKSLDKMLLCFDTYNIRVTFATVGFLFHKTKKQLLENYPSKEPTYSIKKLSPYIGLENYLGKDEDIDPYHFAESLIRLIKKYNSHEFATHTYSHYYCLEDGQTITQFEEDLKLSIAVAKNNNVELKSIVFPRNQYNEHYIKVCKNYGITSYRGTEKSYIYKSSNGLKQSLFKRGLRLLDAYINITGYNCYNTDIIKRSIPYNIPSSRFLRPYNKKLYCLDWLKFLRIKRAMTYAAKKKLVYHLWWHPHNFGRNCKQNIQFLEKILKHYKYLNKKYSFESITMSELSNKLKRI